jgi:hypothetical protein
MRKIWCDRCQKEIPYPTSNLNVRAGNIVLKITVQGLEDDYCEDCVLWAANNSIRLEDWGTKSVRNKKVTVC